jgi:hypothetical protein
MVESTVILSARICAAELATLVAGLSAFSDASPIAAIQSAATAQIEIKQRKGFLTRTRRYVGAKTIFESRAAVHFPASIFVGVTDCVRMKS